MVPGGGGGGGPPMGGSQMGGGQMGGGQMSGHPTGGGPMGGGQMGGGQMGGPPMGGGQMGGGGGNPNPRDSYGLPPGMASPIGSTQRPADPDRDAAGGGGGIGIRPIELGELDKKTAFNKKLAALLSKKVASPHSSSDSNANAVGEPNRLPEDPEDGRITDEGAVSLANLLVDSDVHIHTLDLYSNMIGDEGAATLATAIAHPDSDLVHLRLTANRVDDKGTAALARAVPGSKLEKLNLMTNSVGSGGAKALAEVGRLSTCNP